MPDYRKLDVWRKAHELALGVHRVAAGLRGSEYASLRSQMLRSAMSIPANIVEGRWRRSEREFAQFLRYAVASSSELEYHLIVAHDLHLLAHTDFVSLSDQIIEVRRMLHGLLNRLSPLPTK